MNSDDRDIESSNPSKNFKVGDVDQLSGFFTPVWESKRRIRSEPPGPPSSKGAPSSRTPSQRGSNPPSAPEAASAEERVPGKAGKGIPRPRSAASKAPARAGSGRTPTPVPPPASEQPGAADAAGSAVPLPAEVAAVFSAPTSAEEGGLAAPPGAVATPLPDQPAKDAARPSAAARALRDAGPDLPPAAFLDAEPEFRAPPAPAVPRPARTDRPAAQYHGQRAAQAASRIHDELKAKLQAEAAELEENRLDIDPDTHRDALQALEPSAHDPFPISLMRRLRRTIRLSAPVPDAVRSLISKYDRG
jgi:hypothetical protein